MPGESTCSGPSSWLYPKEKPIPRQVSHFFTTILRYVMYSGVV